jgi:hypothetical protein
MVIYFEWTLRTHEVRISIVMVRVWDLFPWQSHSNKFCHVWVLIRARVNIVAESTSLHILRVEDMAFSWEFIITLGLALSQERVFINHMWVIRELPHGAKMMSTSLRLCWSRNWACLSWSSWFDWLTYPVFSIESLHCSVFLVSRQPLRKITCCLWVSNCWFFVT